MAQDFSHLSMAVSQYLWGTGSRTPMDSKIKGHSSKSLIQCGPAFAQILHTSSQILSIISRLLITPNTK